MQTTKKRILPLGALALMMAFSFTSCDAVLETFYPEFAEGGSNSSGSMELELSIDQSLNGTLVIGLVPYVYDSYVMVELANKDAAQVQTISLPTTLTNGKKVISFPMLPDTTYRMVAFMEDPAKPGQKVPTSDYAKSNDIMVNKKDLFMLSDVYEAKSLGGKINGSIGQATKMKPTSYFELFGDADTSNNAFSLEGPSSINTSVPTTLSAFSLNRPYVKGMEQVTKIRFELTGPSTSINSDVIVSNGGAVKFDLNYSTPFTFLTPGQFKLKVMYWTGDDVKTMPATKFVSRDIFVYTATSGGTGELANYSYFRLGVPVNGLTSGRAAAVSYVDPWGNRAITQWIYSDQTADLGSVQYYDSVSNYSRPKILVEVYEDTTWTMLYSQTVDLDTIPSSFDLNSTKLQYVSVSSSYTGKANLESFTMSLNISPDYWGIPAGATIYVDVYDGSNGYNIHWGTGIYWDGIANPLSRLNLDSMTYTYHAGIADWVEVSYSTDGGYTYTHVRWADIIMNAGQMDFQINDGNLY